MCGLNRAVILDEAVAYGAPNSVKWVDMGVENLKYG